MVDDDPAITSSEMVGEICQFFSTLLVLQGISEIAQEDKRRLLPKLAQWSRTWEGVYAGEASERCLKILTNDAYCIFLSIDYLRPEHVGVFLQGNDGVDESYDESAYSVHRAMRGVRMQSLGAL